MKTRATLAFIAAILLPIAAHASCPDNLTARELIDCRVIENSGESYQAYIAELAENQKAEEIAAQKKATAKKTKGTVIASDESAR